MEMQLKAKEKRRGETPSAREYVEAKLHGESKVIQKCFDDKNDDDKR